MSSQIIKWVIFDCVFRLDTEIWDIETAENRITAPALSNLHYYGVGLFLVDKDFCKKFSAEFSLWSTWLPCSATCGDGTKSRSRSCTAYCDDVNSEDTSENTNCNEGRCKYLLNNYYSNWSLFYHYINCIFRPSILGNSRRKSDNIFRNSCCDKLDYSQAFSPYFWGRDFSFNIKKRDNFALESTQDKLTVLNLRFLN